MKNVCFLIANLNNSGGTERVTTLIANKLSEDNRFQVSILNLSEGKNPFFHLNSNINLYSLYDVKPSFKKQFFSTILNIRNFVKNRHIDILVDVDSILCVFTVPALIGLSTKHICWEHFTFNTNLGVKQRDLGRKLAARYCDYVVTLTNRDKELWEEGLEKINAKIVAIPNPTPYENCNNQPSLDSKVVLAVGRLTYSKGFDLLLQAWKQVVSVKEDWKLQIVGNGEDESKLKTLADQLNITDSVEFIPATQNIAEYYQSASIFCLSSRFEGFGMVILEAMSFGLPVVSFNCEVGPDELVEHYKNGLLAEPLNIADLSDCILEMMNIDNANYTKLSETAYKFSQQYSLEKIKDIWEKLLI